MKNIGDICFDIGCMWMLYDASSGFCWSKDGKSLKMNPSSWFLFLKTI